jgi:hypothetical protein
MVQSTNTAAEAMEYIRRAREYAIAEGQSPARWLLEELRLHCAASEFDEAARLLQQIQARYINQPGVRERLVEILGEFRLLPVQRPSDRYDEGESSMTADPADTSSRLWTPSGAAELEARPASPSGSKLWVPD